MADSKLENVWKIMRNDNYEIVTKIDNDMLCTLCKKILTNVRCAPCGCRFCSICLSEYLEKKNEICPGNTEDCKLEMLNSSENILVDHAMNIKLSKLKVKCSKLSCEFVDEIRKIEDHSRVCKYRSFACQYSNIGCETCNSSQDKVDKMSNEINIMKANIHELSTENICLRNEINELKLNCEKRQEKYVELESKLDEKIFKIEQLNTNLIDLNYKLSYGEFLWKIDKFSEKMAYAKSGIDQSIYSESFITHRNGYKMCLELHPDGSGNGIGRHLSMCFCLMKGDFDDILEWPFQHSVTFSLINQRTRLPHVSLTAKCRDFPNYKELSQPKDRNYGMGSHFFITQNELSSNFDLMRNGQIFIKCSVDIRS